MPAQLIKDLAGSISARTFPEIIRINTDNSGKILTYDNRAVSVFSFNGSIRAKRSTVELGVGQ